MADWFEENAPGSDQPVGTSGAGDWFAENKPAAPKAAAPGKPGFFQKLASIPGAVVDVVNNLNNPETREATIAGFKHGAVQEGLPNVLRIGLPLAGAAIGSAIGPEGTWAGASLGGALGGALGETGAEVAEDRDLNPKQIAAQAALSAIPVVGKVPATLGKAVLARAAQGALIGGGGSALSSLAEDQMPDLSQVIEGAALGGALGTVGGALESRFAPHVAPTETPAVAPAEALPESFGPAAFAGPERRVSEGTGPGGIDRRALRDQPLDFSKPVEAAAAMMQENPNIVKQAAELQARAKASRAPAPPREPKAGPTFDELSNEIGKVENSITATEVPDEVWNEGVTRLKALREEQASRFPDELKARAEAADRSTKQAGLDALGGRDPNLNQGEGDPKLAGSEPYKPAPEPEPVAPEAEAAPVVPPVPPVEPPAAPPTPPMSADDKLRALREERRAGGGPVSAIKQSFNTFRSRFVNQFDQVERFMKDAGLDVIAEPAETNPVKAIDLAHGGTPGKIERVSHEFKDIASIADKAGLTDALEHYLDLNALEAGSQTLSDKASMVFEGEGPGIVSKFELDQGKLLPKGITPADLKAARAEWNARPPEQRLEVEALAKRVFSLNEHMLDVAHDAGLIKPEVFNSLKERARMASESGVGGYAPLNRVISEVQSGYNKSGMNMPAQHALYNLEGSEKLTKHPIVSSFQRAAVVLKEAEKNKAMQTLVNMPENYPGNQMVKASFVKLGQAGAGVVPEGFDRISLFEKGQRVDYAVPAPLASAVKSLDAPTTTVLGQTLFRAMNAVFKPGVTMANVAFSIPNIIKDMSDLRRLETLPGQTAGQTLAKEIPIAPVMKIAGQWAVSLKDVVTKAPVYEKFLDSGAAFGTFQRSLDSLGQMLNLTPKPGALAAVGRVVKSPLEFAKAFNNALEEATKLTAFKRQLAAGASESDAAWATRRHGGSPDFARRGTHIQSLNTVMPFLNAQIQGVDRIVTYVQKHPMATVGAMAALTAKLAMLQQYNNSYTDPDGTRSWDRITDAEKQNNFVVFLPTTFEHEGVVRHNYLLVPIGHTVGLLAGPVRAALDYKARNAQGVLDYTLQNVPTSPNLDLSSKGALAASVGQSALSAANPLIKVPAELYANEDSFRRVPIVPERLKQVEPRQQFTAKTAPSAVAVGNLTNMSPLQIQHAVRGIAGGVGDQVMDLASAAVKPESVKSHIPVVSTVARRFLGSQRGTIDQQERDWNNALYNALAKSQQVTSTVAALRKRGDSTAVEKYLSDPAKMLAYKRAHALQLISQRVSQTRAQQDHEAERQILQSIASALGGGQ